MKNESKEDEKPNMAETDNEGVRSGITVLAEMENQLSERQDSGVGESLSSSLSLEDTGITNSQETVDDHIPSKEPNVKKRLSLELEENLSSERLPKRIRHSEQLSDEEDYSDYEPSPVNNEDTDALCTEQISELPPHTSSSFMTSSDFITSREDVNSETSSSSIGDTIDLTSDCGTESISLKYCYTPVFNSRRPGAQVHKVSAGRQKGVRSSIRVGKVECSLSVHRSLLVPLC